jgi:AcrR family transcriptional regulator
MRKAPRQARSKATVDAIVEAGARILTTFGSAAFSTNQVADSAGVSIGSLYQYFPDKHTIVEAIRSRHLDDVLVAVRAASGCSGTPRVRVACLVDGLIAVHARQPGLHRVLMELAPPHAGAASTDAFEREYLAAYGDVVAALRGRLPAARERAMAAVLSGAIEGAIHAAARDGSVASSRFRRELADLVVAYLSGR